MANINQLQKELAKAAHAYNEKIRYHEQKGRDVLPQREYARNLKKKLTTATDYQREINRLKRFGQADVTKTTTIGAYDNIEITRYELQEMKRQVEQINKRRARKLAKVQEYEVQAAGQPMGYKRAQMPSFREADLLPKQLNLSRFRSKRELELYRETLESQRQIKYLDTRAELFKRNYIKALREQYSSRKERKAIQPIIKRLQNMSNAKVEETYYTEQDATIRYVYEGTAAEEQLKLDNLYRVWGVYEVAPEVTDVSV